MISHINDDFRRCFDRLPEKIKVKARKSFRQFQENPFYPSLDFKQVHETEPVWSVRISDYYRAIGHREGGTIVWYWVGSHPEYERIIRSL